MTRSEAIVTAIAALMFAITIAYAEPTIVAPNQLIQNESESVYRQFLECGIIIPETIQIVFDDLDADAQRFGMTVCALTRPTKPFIRLNQRPELFTNDGLCGPYRYIIAHEFLHVAGFSHVTQRQERNFNALLNTCGFFRDSD